MFLVKILIQPRCLLEGGLSLQGEIENFPLILASIRLESSTAVILQDFIRILYHFEYLPPIFVQTSDTNVLFRKVINLKQRAESLAKLYKRSDHFCVSLQR